jgi:hypothetical protein
MAKPPREATLALDIIGPGFGRTGTSSLKTALEHLGYGPAHHMFEVRDNPAQLPYWQALARGEKPDWNDVFSGYRSQCDWPGARYWRELAAFYPDAKIILTVRDPDEWYDSFEATIMRLMAARGSIDDPHLSGLVDMGHVLIEMGVFNGSAADRDFAISVFNAHNAEVQAAFPTSRLLTFDVREGWEPLCKFLGCEVPAISFPKLNSSKQFTEHEWKEEIVQAI